MCRQKGIKGKEKLSVESPPMPSGHLPLHVAWHGSQHGADQPKHSQISTP